MCCSSLPVLLLLSSFFFLLLSACGGGADEEDENGIVSQIQNLEFDEDENSDDELSTDSERSETNSNPSEPGSPVSDASGIYMPSRFAGSSKKENRTLGRMDSSTSDMNVNDVSKYCADFQDEVLRVPCLHGNSILKFECIADGVVVGESLYLCSQSEGLMFWGGETSCQVTYKSKPVSGSNQSHGKEGRRTDAFVVPTFDLMSTPPSLEVDIVCGKPMLSRCGYVKVKLSGNGPMMASMSSTFGYLSFFIASQ